MPKINQAYLDRINCIQESEAPGYECKVKRDRTFLLCEFISPNEETYCAITLDLQAKEITDKAFFIAENDTVGFSFVDKVVRIFDCSLGRK